jgi:hypothetical protein
MNDGWEQSAGSWIASMGEITRSDQCNEFATCGHTVHTPRDLVGAEIWVDPEIDRRPRRNAERYRRR